MWYTKDYFPAWTQITKIALFSGEFQLPLNSVDLAGPIEEWKDLAPVDDGSNQYLGDLCLSLRYVPSSGKLTVAVLEARKLKKMDITGASDPYVKLKLFDSKVNFPLVMKVTIHVFESLQKQQKACKNKNDGSFGHGLEIESTKITWRLAIFVGWLIAGWKHLQQIAMPLKHPIIWPA